jgi:hypothetical protein
MLLQDVLADLVEGTKSRLCVFPHAFVHNLAETLIWSRSVCLTLEKDQLLQDQDFSALWRES